ncbi:MAG: hypothetical protein ABI416_06260 [Ginsengibacter sp.]
MKTILPAFLLICFSISLNAQVRDTTRPEIPLQFDPDLLFHKARKQTITAVILIVTGAGMVVAGYIMALKNSLNYNFEGAPSSSHPGVIAILAGIASVIAGVPFIISSGKKRKQAILQFQKRSNTYSRQLFYKGDLVSLD